MNTSELKEYLGMVLDEEKNIYLQESIISQLQTEIKELAEMHEIVPPIKPDEPTFPNPTDQLKSGALLILLAPVGSFIAFLGSNGTFHGFNFIFALLALVCMIAGIGGFFCMLGGIGSYFSVRKKNAETQKAYNAALSTYNAAYADYKKRIAEEESRRYVNAKKSLTLKQSLKNIAQQKDNSSHILDSLYGMNVIFPKYRNLVMVASLYEYICSGRCSTLEGHEGAYNILEMEIRLDRIITQLNQVITQLYAIRQNQYTLYTAIEDSNRQSAQILAATNQMASSMESFQGDVKQITGRIDDLQKTSEITAYCTERTQKELSYMNRMNYLTGRNDGPFQNIPPN